MLVNSFQSYYLNKDFKRKNKDDRDDIFILKSLIKNEVRSIENCHLVQQTFEFQIL